MCVCVRVCVCVCVGCVCMQPPTPQKRAPFLLLTHIHDPLHPNLSKKFCEEEVCQRQIKQLSTQQRKPKQLANKRIVLCRKPQSARQSHTMVNDNKLALNDTPAAKHHHACMRHTHTHMAVRTSRAFGIT